MHWTDQLFNYCERGLNPAFWAEPFNALSNASFVLAALFAYRDTRGLSHADPVVSALILLAALIGIGSFLFHTLATRWAAVADIAPIGIFMLTYLAFTMRRLLAMPWIAIGPGLAAFVVAIFWMGSLECDPQLLPLTSASGRRCLNGSLTYVPTFFALSASAALLFVKGHPAAGYVATGAVIFGLSLIFRSLDVELCALTPFFGQARGTHALWHLLNGGLLYLLMRAAMVSHGTSICRER